MDLIDQVDRIDQQPTTSNQQPLDRHDWPAVQGVREKEKAAAMDAAIDYEDAWQGPRDEGQEGTQGTKGTQMIQGQGQGQSRDVIAELVDATTEFMRARRKMMGLVLEVAQVQGDLGAAEPQAGNQQPQTNNDGRAKPGRRRSELPAGKTRYLPQEMIQCRKCGAAVTGVKERDGNRYPYRHKNRITGSICQGEDLPGGQVQAANEGGPLGTDN